jgi:hypothetical protein
MSKDEKEVKIPGFVRIRLSEGQGVAYLRPRHILRIKEIPSILDVPTNKVLLLTTGTTETTDMTWKELSAEFRDFVR